MSQGYDFYIARADQAAGDALSAKLDNVRAQALRSEAAWREMADRALKVDQEREKARVERDARSAAEGWGRA